jgi:hypothetical protein
MSENKLRVLELTNGDIEILQKINCTSEQGIVTDEKVNDFRSFLISNLSPGDIIVTGKVSEWMFNKLPGYIPGKFQVQEPVQEPTEETTGKTIPNVYDYQVINSTWVHNNLICIVPEKPEEDIKYILLENFHFGL